MYAHALTSVDPHKAEPVFRALMVAAKQAESSSGHNGSTGSRTGAQMLASIQIVVPFGGLLLRLQRYQEAVQLLEEEVNENSRALVVLESNTNDSTLLAMLKPSLAGLASLLETAKALSAAEC